MAYLDEIRNLIGNAAVTKDSVTALFDQYDVDVGGDDVRKAALIHNYLYYYVDFEWREDRDLRSVPELLKRGGNCEEQTVALSVLLEHLPSVDQRLLSISDGDVSHALLEVSFEADDPNDVADSLRQLYDDSYQINWAIESISWETDGDHWFVTDPEMSVYIGDIRSHRDQGYAYMSGDTSWEWNYVNEVENGI